MKRKFDREENLRKKNLGERPRSAAELIPCRSILRCVPAKPPTSHPISIWTSPAPSTSRSILSYVPEPVPSTSHPILICSSPVPSRSRSILSCVPKPASRPVLICTNPVPSTSGSILSCVPEPAPSTSRPVLICTNPEPSANRSILSCVPEPAPSTSHPILICSSPVQSTSRSILSRVPKPASRPVLICTNPVPSTSGSILSCVPEPAPSTSRPVLICTNPEPSAKQTILSCVPEPAPSTSRSVLICTKVSHFVAQPVPSTSRPILNHDTEPLPSTSRTNAEAYCLRANAVLSTFEEPTRDPKAQHRWNAARSAFAALFTANEFGHACNVCDRLWFKNDLRKVVTKHYAMLRTEFPLEPVMEFVVCSNCRKCLDRGSIPALSKSNGFYYPLAPKDLPALDPVTARLIAPRLPFMQLRRLRYDGAVGIVGQVINVPIDVNETVQQLPRQLDSDFSINVNIKKRLTHKSTYLKGVVKKSTVRRWLQYLVSTPLYRHYNINIDWSALNGLGESPETLNSELSVRPDAADELIETLGALESECLLARQHTLLWNEEMCLNIAPGQHSIPLNIIYDIHAEELSFPSIYYGVARIFKQGISVTPYMMATSEIRRRDRRGVTPDHILYMAMKILRLRVTEGIHSTFKSVQNTEGITRKMIEDKSFLELCVERNLAFLKTIPNSVQYWANRKKDLFAMLRQLGKPTMFLTVSANEIGWSKLLKTLHRLSLQDDSTCGEIADVLADLSRSRRSELVNEDPVTCCIYFYKLVGVILRLIQSPIAAKNPFGQHRVIDFFLRIEFQHRGSPHAHILLWLANDPREPVSEHMPKTIQLVTDLCSVAREDVQDTDASYCHQIHRHTFTCTKRGEATCRFNIPFWPMDRTRVLLPMSQSDGRRLALQARAKKLKQMLETNVYNTMGDFLRENKLTMGTYLEIIRASVRKPTLIFKRDMTQLMTNTFNPFISSVLSSNMDLQLILEEYSCAAYVVEYVNKSVRGISDLHRQLLQLTEEQPELNEQALLKNVCLKLLNSVEMSSQEAAWYLLRQPMSYSSREVAYIPTMWPHERQKSRKRKAQLDREGIGEDSTDIWTKNVIQKYEERPENMESICLADFVAKYKPRRSNRSGNHAEATGDGEEEPADLNDGDALERELDGTTEYVQRKQSRVIRSRCYDIEDTHNYKRELLTLYIPFRVEAVEILDRDCYLEVYEQREAEIMAKRQEYEANINIAKLMEELRELCAFDAIELPSERREELVQHLNVNDNIDDIEMLETIPGIAVVGRRQQVLSKQDYCERMRTTNYAQRELLLEVIHRLHEPTDRPPIQIFFTGPAGCGKTYLLRLLMETYNRYTQHHNSMRNAYVACASTGKAAVNIGGTTVHSAFKIAAMSNEFSNRPMTREVEQTYRGMFNGVCCVIVDEISMIGSGIFHKIDNRLRQITGVHDRNFGGLDIILCGDLRQLPPVCSTPIFKSNRHTIGGPCLWQSLEFYQLSQVMRQSDEMFSSILTKIGNGIRLAPEEQALIESRFRPINWCDANLSGVTRLYHQNASVDAYNLIAIQTDIESIADDSYSGHRSVEELSKARIAIHKKSTTETAGMPYLLRLGIGHPYMIMVNMDVTDGLVNGAIGKLRYIEADIRKANEESELLAQGLVTSEATGMAAGASSDNNSGIGRLWLQFEDVRIGRLARVKARPYVLSRPDILKEGWTPISKRNASISLSRAAVKCRRSQFPLSPACALTIHKSQGGTFDQVVVEYDSKQQTQLVYVAMSRVTSIDGLYLINRKGDHNFYHGARDDGSQISREIRQEFTRLQHHELPTLTSCMRKFVCRDTTFVSETIANDQLTILMATHNCQSLVAHSDDISSDQILQYCDLLSLTETWMQSTVPVTGFKFIVSDSSSMKNNGRLKRSAGGVAIYSKLNSVFQCEPLFQCDKTISDLGLRLLDPSVGDICMVNVKLKEKVLFIVACVYMHPGVHIDDIKLLIFSSLARYSSVVANNVPELDMTHIPLIITGDFNVCSDSKKDELAEFLFRDFSVSPVKIKKATTLGNTEIDLTFSRLLGSILCEPYVSYFSYHRPLLHKINVQ